MRTKELAAIPEKALLEYVKFLYLGAVAISQDAVPKPLLDKAKSWQAVASKVDKYLESDLVSAITQMVKTRDHGMDLAPYVKSLRANLRAQVYSDAKVSHQVIDNLRALTAYLSSRSEPAFRKLLGLSTQLGEKEISASLTVEAKSQTEFLKPLERIVYAATKQRGRTTLTAEEGKSLKASHPEVYREYLKLRRGFNLVWKDELRTLVNDSGRKAVSYQAARKALDSRGIQNTMSDTFEGLVDASGTVYTKAGKRIPGLPGPGFVVKMNPEYDPKTDDTFVFTTLRETDGKTSQYVYTVDYRKTANKAKFEKVEELDKKIDAIRKKWMTFVKNGTNAKEPQTQASVILELLYQFSARIGSRGNKADGKDTYGLSTILVSNVKITGTKMRIAYLGKDAVKQVHLLDGSTPEGKILVRLISQLIEGKGPKERVWDYESSSGRQVQMTGNMVNKWFTKLGAPPKVTVHKLRHVRGTRLFNELVSANEKKIFGGTPKTEAQSLEILKKLATQVGKLLGHVRGVGGGQTATGATAITNYIDPAVQAQFFDRLGVRYPKYLDKLMSSS
jgi:integrase